MDDLFTWRPPTGEELRDEGIATVSRNERAEWMENAVSLIAELPVGWQGIGAHIRDHVLRNGLGEPHHANVWGALINKATRRKLIERTGRIERSKTPSAHARTCPIIVRI